MNETLRQKQTRFALAVAHLIQKADELGYEMTIGEVERSKAQASANAASGAGISSSLHCERLAIDLHLFKNGRYITDNLGHSELGRWWKSLNPDHRWGGDFAKKDFNHYSLSPDGRRA
jgi:hypothetical protein